MDEHTALPVGTGALQGTVLAALFAALTAVGAYITIPLPFSPVPIVLQNMFIMLSGLLLGSRRAALSVAIYLLLGAAGLPVFAGGTGGIAHFAGPTGGYLISYLPAVWIIGRISGIGAGSMRRDITALLAGTAVIYAAGVTWLAVSLSLTAGRALAIGMLPYLPGDLLKIAAAAAAARYLRPLLHQAFPDLERTSA